MLHGGEVQVPAEDVLPRGVAGDGDTAKTAAHRAECCAGAGQQLLPLRAVELQSILLNELRVG